MRVCHVIHNLQPGGAEDLLVDLATVAPSVGIELSVLSLLPLAGHRHAARLQALDVPVVSLDLRSRWSPLALAHGVRAVAGLTPDLVHTHLKHADLVGGVAARRLALPHVSTLHVIEDARSPVQRGKRQVAALVRQRSADRVLAVSDAQRLWYLRTFPRADGARIRTLRNGVMPPPAQDAAERRALRGSLGATDGDLLVLMVGIMRPGKGHDQLLDALAELGAEPRMRVVLAGDGPLRQDLERRVEHLGDRVPPVVFAGFRDDVPALMAASDLVVHPSLAEALPTALIHALAAGRAVVATDVGGTPEVVTPDIGPLVPAGDARALAGALRPLLHDEEARAAAGAAARRRFEAEFDATAWARRLQQTYGELLAAPPRRST